MASMHCQHNGSAAGIHGMTMVRETLWIPGTTTFALLRISYFVFGGKLPFSGEDPPGSE